MTKVIGIDPGTKSFDFCGLDNDTVILNKSIPSDDVASHPEFFAETIESIDADLIVGPSGYGLPVKRLSELNERDFFLLTLVKPEELDKIMVTLKGAGLAHAKTDKLSKRGDKITYFATTHLLK